SRLSTRLYLREWLHQRRQPALLLGPYGRSIDFSPFGTIVFIVEDIGMLRVLPYIRMLVQGERAAAGHDTLRRKRRYLPVSAGYNESSRSISMLKWSGSGGLYIGLFKYRQ
ncbi:hypothetical protein ABHI18_010817, partial [Aspergillus niger]